MIEFPGLGGIQIEAGREAIVNLFGIQGFSIYWYGIILASAFLLAIVLATKNCTKFDIDKDTMTDAILFSVPASIIGARLFYVIFSWDMYKENLLDIFNTRKGGLAIYGGVIAAFITVWIYSKIKNKKPVRIIDFAVPYIALGQAIGRWGNFFNQEAFGSPTMLAWRMNGSTIDIFLENLGLNAATWGVHPTFFYESFWNFALFIFLIWFRNKKKKDGEVLFLYASMYGLGRFFIEGLRTDSLMIGSTDLRVSQLIAGLSFLGFIAAFIWLRNSGKTPKPTEEIKGESEYTSLIEKLNKDEDVINTTESEKIINEQTEENLSDKNDGDN